MLYYCIVFAIAKAKIACFMAKSIMLKKCMQSTFYTFLSFWQQIIHHYGHGGYGVTTAPGTAKYALKLIEEMLDGNKDNIKANLWNIYPHPLKLVFTIEVPPKTTYWILLLRLSPSLAGKHKTCIICVRSDKQLYSYISIIVYCVSITKFV